MDRDNIDDTFMKRLWRREGLGKFDREAFERRRAYINWKREHWRAIGARDEGERLKAQKEQKERGREDWVPADRCAELAEEEPRPKVHQLAHA